MTAPRVLLLYLFITINIYILCLNCYDNIDRICPVILKNSTRQIFFHTHEKVVKIHAEQSGFLQTVLIQTQTVVHNQLHHRLYHRLYQVIPFSLSPPPRVIYKSSQPFVWCANDSTDILFIINHLGIKIFQQTQIGKSTLGSWHRRQFIEISLSMCNLSMCQKDQLVIIINSEAIYGLFQLNSKPLQYFIQRLALDQVKLDFKVFPKSLHDNVFILSSPMYRQTDGIVDTYRITGNFDLTDIEFSQTIKPPVQAGYFGGYCSLAHPFLIVSAQFANEGKGVVYVYRITGEDFVLFQTIKNNDNTVSEFGKQTYVSNNCQWLLVNSASQKMFVFSLVNNQYSLAHTCHEQVTEFCVDDQGNTILVIRCSQVILLNMF